MISKLWEVLNYLQMNDAPIELQLLVEEAAKREDKETFGT
jgi:hypothetical protein